MYIARDPKRKREQIRIYSLKFPPKEIQNKVNIMQDIRKSIMEHEKSLKGGDSNKENQPKEAEDDEQVNIERVKVKIAIHLPKPKLSLFRPSRAFLVLLLRS